MENKQSLLFSGDFVFSRKKEEQEFIISKEYMDIIKQHDMFCCNLEGPIIEQNCKKIRKIGPNINNDIFAVKKMIDYGCNLFCLANNHIFDYGISGLRNTINFLETEKIPYIGAQIKKEKIYKPYIFDKNGLKTCFINIAENGFGAAVDNEYGYAYAFNNKIEEMIKTNREKNDFVIVIAHMGAEKWEIPLPEIREFYKKMIDFGADAVIAHHPHVPQGWEEYNNKIIFYSLGNFIFDKGKGIQNPNSFSISLELEKEKNIKYRIIPTIFENFKLKITNTNYSNLQEILKNKTIYEDILNKKLEETYTNDKKSYYKIVCRDTGSLKEKIKGFVKRNIYRRKFEDIWLYHNVNIETHLWIARRISRRIIEDSLKEQ